MSTIVTRAGKGSVLTWADMDNNLNNLNYGSYVSVKDSAYGAKGDGVTDDTAAIQAAIDGLGASGGILYFPKGWYAVTQLNITVGQITLQGEGLASRLLSSDNVSDVIHSTAGYLMIDRLVFANKGGTVRTGANYINCIGGETYITNCKFMQGYTAISIGPASGIITIDNCHFRDFNTNGTSDVILIDTTGADVSINECVFDNNASLMPRSGIRINSCQDVNIVDCNVIHCGKDLWVIPTAGKVVASLYATNTFFDTAQTGIYLGPSGGNIVRTQFLNCWTSSHTGNGVVVDASVGGIMGVTFVNHQTHLNGINGVLVQGPNSSDIVFSGGEASQNVGSGVTCSATVTGLYIRNFHAGTGHGLTGNDYGIYIPAGVTNYEISNCVCIGNTTNQIVDLAKTGRVYHNNAGTFKTYNSGTGSIAIGTNNVYITHGLNTTPNAGDIHLTPHVTYSNNWIALNPAGIGATTFQVISQVNAAAYNFDFGWSASCQNDH